MKLQSKKNILIIGSGGREHALAWKLAQDPSVDQVYCAPGNPGTKHLGTNIAIEADDIKNLLFFAQSHQIDLTIVGPEVPLSLGIVDLFTQSNMAIFGPSKAAANLEIDKAFAAEFMNKHHIPHPESISFSDVNQASAYIQSHDPHTYVLKAAGLCGGKGVVLPESVHEAIQTTRLMMSGELFGEAGKTLVIQERLAGQEISVFALSDGMTVVALLPAQDHKRLCDDDKGPNTGGMGAYAPVPFVTSEMMQTIFQKILQPTITGMGKDGIPYQGVLFAGIMLTIDGPKVLEYNVRFGDPETQPLLLLLESDLLPLLQSCVGGTLANQAISFKKGYAATITLAAKGYPEKPQKGDTIEGLDDLVTDPHIHVFHAGTAIKEGEIITQGGRVLSVAAYGQSISTVLKSAYGVIGKNTIHFSGMQYRKDIGKDAYGS